MNTLSSWQMVMRSIAKHVNIFIGGRSYSALTWHPSALYTELLFG